MGKISLALKAVRSVLTDEAYAKKLAEKKLTLDGESIVDPTPQAPPVGYKKQLSMVEIVREQVRNHLSQVAADQGFETFDESEDFEVEDEDPLPASAWENEFDPPVQELRQAVASARSEGVTGEPSPVAQPTESPPAKPDLAKPTQ